MNNDVVIINLDRPRQLKFGHTALKTLVSLTGKSIEEIDQNFDVQNYDLVEQAVYCGLLFEASKKGETITLEQIPALLDEAPSQRHVWDKVAAAWRVTFGAAITAPEGNMPAPAEQPAKRSNSTGKSRSESQSAAE